MKTYMALDGLRWSRDSASVHCNVPRSAVFGRSGGRVSFLKIIERAVLLCFLDVFDDGVDDELHVVVGDPWAAGEA